MLSNLLNRRHSCRSFRDDEVPRHVLDQILEMAQRTPSWGNTQPWRVYMVSGQVRDGLARALSADESQPSPDLTFPDAYDGKFRERRRESGWMLYRALGIASGDRAASAAHARRNLEFFGAPHVAVITAPTSLGVYGAVDCGLYVQSLLLAATALGIASCPQAAIAARSQVLHAQLGIPQDESVVCGIALGYEDTSHPANSIRVPRIPLDHSVSHRAASEDGSS